MKKILTIGVIIFNLLLIGCGKKEKEEDKKYTLKIGISVGDKDPMYAGLMEFKKNVSEKTDGNVIIEIYPSGQLGNNEDLIEQAKLGANVGVITDSGRLSEFVKGIGVTGVAYVAKDYDEMKKIIETPLFNSYLAQLNDYNLDVLSFNWYQGARHFWTNKKIETPEDLKGLLVRTPGQPAWRESIAALGATPTALPWNEVYPAMQQKVIDAFEAQTPAVYAASLQETVKYVSKTGHFQLMTGIVIGTDWMNKLPENYRKTLKEEAQLAGEYASQKTLGTIEEYENEMKAKGVEFTDINVDLFRKKAMKAVIKLGYEKEYKQLQNQIK